MARSGDKENTKLGYTPRDDEAASNHRMRKKNQKKRRLTWFNPLFAGNFSTDLGKIFLHLIGKHFTKDSPLSKILNKYTVKLSYSCMPNMRATILQHNNRLLQDDIAPAFWLQLQEIRLPPARQLLCRKPYVRGETAPRRKNRQLWSLQQQQIHRYCPSILCMGERPP